MRAWRRGAAFSFRHGWIKFGHRLATYYAPAEVPKLQGHGWRGIIGMSAVWGELSHRGGPDLGDAPTIAWLDRLAGGALCFSSALDSVD